MTFPTFVYEYIHSRLNRAWPSDRRLGRATIWNALPAPVKAFEKSSNTPRERLSSQSREEEKARSALSYRVEHPVQIRRRYDSQSEDAVLNNRNLPVNIRSPQPRLSPGYLSQ